MLVPVGSPRAVELVPEAAGDRAVHHHMTHPVKTQRGPASPSWLGAKADSFGVWMRAAPGRRAPIDLGGMFTGLKVREHGENGIGPQPAR